MGAMTLSAESIFTLEDPRPKPCGNFGALSWPGQASSPQVDPYPGAVAIINELSVIAVCLLGDVSPITLSKKELIQPKPGACARKVILKHAAA